MNPEDARNRSGSGVYAIHNDANSRHYVGSAVNLKCRTRDHFSKLRKNIHENKHLQRAFNKYGENFFWVQVLEIVPEKKNLTKREQFYMDSTLPYYNILRTARSGLGFKHSEEERLRIKERIKAKFASMTPDERRQLLLSNGFSTKGKVMSAESRQKKRLAMTGQKKSESERAAIAKRWKENGAKVQEASVAAQVKRYIVTTPAGVEIEIENLSKFCRENELSQAHMSAASLGLKRGYKGWLCRYRDNPIAYDDSRKPRYQVDGKMLTVLEIGALLGLHKNTVRYHIKKSGIDNLIHTHRR
jgi:group I intron endonuclease